MTKTFFFDAPGILVSGQKAGNGSGKVPCSLLFDAPLRFYGHYL